MHCFKTENNIFATLKLLGVDTHHSGSINKISFGKSMKKVVVVLSLLIFLAVVAVSCKTREKCPAYREYSKFQSEKR